MARLTRTSGYGTGTRRAATMFAATAIVVALALAGGPAAAQEFEVPDGFVVDAGPAVDASDEWRHLMTVTPAEGAFAHLSAIYLRELRRAVEDPDAWLKARLSGDLGDLSAAEQLFNSPDSPFGDPAFDALREVIPEILEGFRALAELPLKFCDGPQLGYNVSGEFRELYCVYEVGPVRQYQVLRLQRAAGRWFYTEIVTMNERRLRHLLAIANSFTVDG
ncbi:MAG: hypothetical protein V3S95_09230 [Alphaproteobacteria bacterium]